MRPALGIGIVFASALFFLSGTARADAESDAKDLFARGRELRGRGECAGAVPLFRKAYAIYPRGLGTLRNVAECEEQVGHFASARRAWLDLKRALVALPSPDAKYDGWDRDADDAASRLAPKVASVVVDVVVKTPESEGPATERSGVELVVNGESLGTSLVGTPLERDPGSYRVRAQAADAKPVEQDVHLAAGENKRITLRLERATSAAPAVVPAPAQPPPPTTEPPAEPRDKRPDNRTLGWVVTGVGGAILAGGVVTLVLRQSALADVDDRCPTHAGCDPSLEDAVDRGKTMSTLTSILLPAGVVGIGAGLTLVLTSGPRRTGLTVTPRLGGADATWRF